MGNSITIEGRDGTFGVYIARLTALPAPAVVSRHNGAHYNAAAALAHGRTTEFLNRQLR
jgi:hypothetical protein